LTAAPRPDSATGALADRGTLPRGASQAADHRCLLSSGSVAGVRIPAQRQSAQGRSREFRPATSSHRWSAEYLARNVGPLYLTLPTFKSVAIDGLGDSLAPLSVSSASDAERPRTLQTRRRLADQSVDELIYGHTRCVVQRQRLLGESRGIVALPSRPKRSRQGLDEACRTFGGRHSAATSAGPSSGCSDHRRNAMGMARRLGDPLASESPGQRLASSVQQDESHSCFERDDIASCALAEVRSIVALVDHVGSCLSPPVSRQSRHRGPGVPVNTWTRTTLQGKAFVATSPMMFSPLSD